MALKSSTEVARVVGPPPKALVTKRKKKSAASTGDASETKSRRLARQSESTGKERRTHAGSGPLDARAEAQKSRPKLRSLKSTGYSGWEPIEGITHLGCEVHAEVPIKKKAPRIVRGIVVADQKSDGLLVLDDATSEIVKITPSPYDKSMQPKLRARPGVKWSYLAPEGDRVASGASTALELRLAMSGMKSPMALVQIATKDLWRHEPTPDVFLFGQIEWIEKRGRRLVQVTDPQGREHVFSPMRTPFRAFLCDATEGSKWTQLDDLATEPVQMLSVEGWDPTEWQERIGGVLLPERLPPKDRPELSKADAEKIQKLPKGALVANFILKKNDSRSVAKALVDRFVAKMEKAGKTKGGYDWAKKTELRLHFPEQLLSAILEYGFLSQHQTVYSTGGDMDNEMRAKLEAQALGLRLDSKTPMDPESESARMSPKYTHVFLTDPTADFQTTNSADTYGNVVAVLKDDVKQRTIWSPVDTKVAYENGDDLEIKSFSTRSPLRPRKHRGMCFEGLTYGELSIEDVKEWMIMGDVSKDTLRALVGTGLPVWSSKLEKHGRVRDALISK